MNIRGQLNRNQFFAAAALGCVSGFITLLVTLQDMAHIWAGEYAALAVTILSTVVMGLTLLRRGLEIPTPVDPDKPDDTNVDFNNITSIEAIRKQADSNR